MPPVHDVGGMEALSVQLIRDAHKADHITDKVARAVAEATHTLCLWAADPAVPEALVAARVTEAVGKVRDIAERVARQRAPRISEHTQGILVEALHALQSFISDGDDDEDLSFNRTNPQMQSCGNLHNAPGNSMSMMSPKTGGKSGMPNPLDPAATSSPAGVGGGATIAQGGDGSFKRMGVRARSNLLLRTMTPAEKERAMMRACGYMRLLVCGVWLISSLMMLGVGVLAIEAFANANNGWQKYHSRDFLMIAVDALDALYPALLADDVDIKYTGVNLASQLLADLSTTRAIGKYSQDKMSFYDAGNRLYEFRAGTQDFTTADQQVTAMLTPRHYASLCRINTSFPLMSTNDAGWMVKSFVIPQLAPYDCANDATPDGVFAEVKPPYITYSPFVRTYRRNPARVCNTYISNFQISVAVTLDWTPIQNLLVSPSTFFGAENLFSFANDVDGWWKRDLVLTLVFMDLVLLGALMLVAQVFTVPALQFRGHRAVFAVALTVTSVVVVVIAYVVVGRVIEDAAQEAHLMRIKNVGRCLASGFTSPVFEQYPAARVAFIQQALAGTLKGNLFFLRGDAGEVYPPDMQSVADAINSQDILLHAYGQTVGRRGGYAYATYAQPGVSRVIVMTDTVQTDWVSLSRCKKLIIGMEFAVLVFALVVLYLSPLKGVPLVFASGSALLTHRLQLGLLRQLYFLVLAVTIVVAVAGLNYYGDTLLKEAMTKNAGDLMEVLAVTNRASTLVDACGGSCGFSSYLLGLYFTRGSDNTANYVPASMSLPYSDNGNWTNQYLGAQLVMARLPMVLHAMPSFFAPIVNETTGAIHADSVVRDLAVAVDINETDGFVIERLNPTYGHAGGQYTFVSQSIGLAIVGCMLCVSFTLMEWAYSRLLRLSPNGWLAMRARCDGGKEDAVVPHAEGVDEEGLSSEKKVARRRLLRALYVLSASLLLSCAVLISAGVMRGRMRASLEQHADEEMSRVVSGSLARFEAVGLGRNLAPLTPLTSSDSGSSRSSHSADTAPTQEVEWGDTVPAVNTYNLAVVIEDVLDGLESSIAPYIRWRLLQEWPFFGSGRVRVLAGPEDLNVTGDVPTYDPGSMNYGAVPVCGSGEGTWLTPQLPRRKRYCFSEVPGSAMSDGVVMTPRNYLLLFTDEESTIVAPVEDAWWELMVASIVVTVALCLAYIVLAWWFLLACDHHDFSPFASGDLLTVQGAIPRFFRSVDMYIPVRFRKRWAMTTTFGILVVLLYYCVSMQLLFQGVDTSKKTAIAVWTQQMAMESIIEGAIMDAFNYVIAGQPASLTSLQNRAAAVGAGVAGYEFVSAARQTELASNISALGSYFAGLPNLPSTRSTQLAATGWESYQTYVAEQYVPYAASQEVVKGYVSGLYESFSMYFSSDFAEADAANITSDENLRAQFILVLDTILQLNDYLVQFFILDHVAVASYLTFGGTVVGGSSVPDNSEWPFLPSGTPDPGAASSTIVETTLSLGEYLLTEIAALAVTLSENCEAIYVSTPALLSVTQESITGVKNALPAASVLFSTIFSRNAVVMEKMFPSAAQTTSTAATTNFWASQQSRVAEVNYINNLTEQTLASNDQAAAVSTVLSYVGTFNVPATGETTMRKYAQLHEYMSSHAGLSNMNSEARWEAYRYLLQTRQSVLVAFVCACVFYGVWLIASVLWFAMAREQVFWWLRGSTSSVASRSGTLSSSSPERQPLVSDDIEGGERGKKDDERKGSLSTGSGSGSGSRSVLAAQQPTRRRGSSSVASAILRRNRNRYVLTIFLLLALFALVPVGLIYKFAEEGIRAAASNNGVLSMGLRTVDCQVDVDSDARQVFTTSGESYATGYAAEFNALGTQLETDVMRMCHTYMWQSSDGTTTVDPPANLQLATAADPYGNPNVQNDWAIPGTGGAGPTAPDVAPEINTLIELSKQLKHVIKAEMELSNSAVQMQNLPDFHVGLGTYAVSILENIVISTTEAPDPTNPTGPAVPTTTYTYNELMPLSCSYGTSAVYTYTQYLFTTYTAQAKAATTLQDFQDVVTKYRDLLITLDNIPEAQLMAWHVAIMSARKDGSVSASNYGPQTEALVNSATLAAMSDGSSEGQAALTEAETYFAPLLAIIGTEADVTKYFVDGEDGGIPMNPIMAATFSGMLTAAGIASSTLTPLYTIATFQSLYAFNRGLVPLSSEVHSYIVGYMAQINYSSSDSSNTWSSQGGAGYSNTGGATQAFVPSTAPADASAQLFTNATAVTTIPGYTESLMKQTSALVAYSRDVVQVGVTGGEEYIRRPATRNHWIWQEEVFATVLAETTQKYSDPSYLLGCIVWCGTCAMWIAVIALVYLMYGMELLL